MIKYMFLFLTIFLIACNNTPKGDKAVISEVIPKQNVSLNAHELNSDDIYKVNTRESKIYWTGSKPTGKHHGVLNCKSGEFLIKDNVIIEGKVVLDMTSISDESLTGTYKAKLEKHLKGNDFFDVAHYPEAGFEILRVKKSIQNSSNTYRIIGNLKVKNIEKQIEFKADVEINPNELIVSAPQFTFDRTLFGIKFKSKKFFPSLKDKFIDDMIGISIKIKAEKNN